MPVSPEQPSRPVLTKWLKADGDYVEVDEPICELETEKASLTLPSPQSGRICRLVEEWQEVEVGQPLVRFDPPDPDQAK